MHFYTGLAPEHPSTIPHMVGPRRVFTRTGLGIYMDWISHSRTRTNEKIPSLYLKKADLASRNIVHHLNSNLRCIDRSFLLVQ